MEVKQITEERFIECMSSTFPTFKITKSNLTYPTSHFVSSFYSLILRQAIELNSTEEIWNLTENQHAYLNSYHPETTTFVQHVLAHNLHATIKYIFNQLRQSGTEFFYSDILFPENTPRRTFVFMTLMLHFYCYTIDFEEAVRNNIDICWMEIKSIENFKSEKEKLLLQVEELKNQRTQYAESSKDTKASITKFTELNDEKENILKELLSKEELVYKDLEKGEDEEQKFQDMLNKLQNEKKYLESLIVSNQNQVVDVYKKRLTKKHECVKKIKAHEEQVKAASNKLLQSNKVLELQQKLHSLLKDEKYVGDQQGKFKEFKNLCDSVALLNEKMFKLSEEESSVKIKIFEAEETLPRLKSEYSQLETQYHGILSKGKEKTGICVNLIDSRKKNHSQMFTKMKKYAEEVEEFTLKSSDINVKCEEIEEKIKHTVAENKSNYFKYVSDISSILNLVHAVLSEN